MAAASGDNLDAPVELAHAGQLDYLTSRRSGRQIDPATVRRMREVIRHRGPDDDGLYVERARWVGPPAVEHR